MYRVPPERPPTDFRLASSTADVSTLIVDPSALLSGPAMRPQPPPEDSNDSRSWSEVTTWWDHWAPVAATGWGAPVALVSLLIGRAVLWVVSTRRRGGGTPR